MAASGRSGISPHDRRSTPRRSSARIQTICRQQIEPTLQAHRPRSPADQDALERLPQSQDTQDHPQARKRRRLSLAKIRETFDDDQRISVLPSDRVEHWLASDGQTAQPPHPFREQFARARRTSSFLGRKRSSGSLLADTASTCDSMPSENNFYRDARVEIALRSCGSFLDDHPEGISATSRRNCQSLLSTPQDPPEGTLFTDELFPQLCRLVKGQNEATVIRFILPHLVPSARIRALRGASHLRFLNETIDAIWINAFRCCDRRPQPDYALGIDRQAFSPEQLRKLQPYIPSRLDEESCFTATYDVCFPFLTTEVKCGTTALDIADRQNALSQTVSLRGLVALFRLVGREAQLHREVLSFSISHDNEAVRIYGHYPYITGPTETFHRCVIASFDIVPSLDGDRKSATSTFVQNLHDIWAPDHFELVCSAVDALPTDPDHTTPSQTTQAPILEPSQASEPHEAQESQATGTVTRLSGLANPPLTPETSTTTGRKKQRAGSKG